MSEPTPILIPLLNPNEPEALLAVLHVTEGQAIAVGDLLCTLETTKSTAELTAEASGYVVGLRSIPGQTVRAGDILCYLAATPDWTPPIVPENTSRAEQDSSQPINIPEGLRITQPALALAQRHNLDLSHFPSDVFVTEKMIQELLAPPISPDLTPPTSSFDSTAIIVYGGGGHGKSLIDLLRTLGSYCIVGIVDDGISAGTTIMGLPVIGGAEVLTKLYANGIRLAVNAVGGIGNLTVRIKVFQTLAQAGFVCPALVHPTAFIEPSAALSPGVQIMPHAYVGSESHIGFGAIINTRAIVSHDCQVGDYANLSPGAILAGEVQVGAGALVGMGATINLQVKIGSRARIGNGATVKTDVPENGIVRAGAVWPE
jgi:acetyltransferase EpsM